MSSLIKNIWDNVKTPFRTTALVIALGLLPSSCKDNPRQEREPIKDLAYYHYNHLPHDEKDMYGNQTVAHTLEIKTYKDATMIDEKNGNIVQIRWGIPQSELGMLFDVKKTHAEFVYLDEVSSYQGWVEVFDNEYGISICKDQPCFLVDKKGRLRLIGDKDHYDRNLRRYKKELDHDAEIARAKAERNRQLYQERRQGWDDKQAAIVKDQNLQEREDTVPQITDIQVPSLAGDSVVADSFETSKVMSLQADTLRSDSLNQGR